MLAKRKKVTMQDIADRVGVSKYAVSKALSGKSGISAATREKIYEIAARLGYVNRKTMRMVQERTEEESGRKIVVVMIAKLHIQNRQSGYWGKVLDGICKRLEEIGIAFVMMSEDSSDALSRMLNPAGVMGVIGVGFISTSFLIELRKKSIPFILVDHEDEVMDADQVFVNNFDLLHKLTRLLIGTGHIRLQFVGDPRFSRSFYDRWRGYRAALEQYELPYELDGGLLNIRPYMEREQEDAVVTSLRSYAAAQFPTAFVCANDQIARLTAKALETLSKRIPEDCSLTGFDNNVDVLVEFPGLTTIHAEKEALGIKAVHMLQWRVEHPQMPFEKVLIQGDIILRESTETPID